MPSRKSNNVGFPVEFLSKSQAMAYTNRLTENKFNEEILPYVHVYKGGKGGIYYLPELRKVVMNYIEILPKQNLL